MQESVKKDIEKIIKQAGAKSLPETPIKKLKVIWLHLSECTGCSESFTRCELLSFEDMIFDIIDLDYHETFMASSGFLADEMLECDEEFVLLVEGALSEDGFFTAGANALSSKEHLSHLAKKAKEVFAIGSCSSYGGIQAAKPNPTKSYAINELLDRDVVLIPGCPPSDINIIATLVYYACFNEVPKLTDDLRPAFAYAKCLHDMCERKVAFESGNFTYEFGDDASKNGACLFYLGCKGPYTYNNCPKTKFNSKTSWPVRAGHGCIACSEKNFWDDFGNYERPIRGDFFEKSTEFVGQNEDKYNKKLTLDDNGIKDNEYLSNIVFDKILPDGKLGSALLQNYTNKYFAPSHPSFELNGFAGLLKAAGWFLYQKDCDINMLLDIANKYDIKIPSEFDYKITHKDGINIDFSKAFRLVFIYRLGGLDDEAILFGLCVSIVKCLKNISDELLVSYEKTQMFSHQIFKKLFYKYGL